MRPRWPGTARRLRATGCPLGDRALASTAWALHRVQGQIAPSPPAAHQQRRHSDSLGLDILNRLYHAHAGYSAARTAAQTR